MVMQKAELRTHVKQSFVLKDSDTHRCFLSNQLRPMFVPVKGWGPCIKGLRAGPGEPRVPLSRPAELAEVLMRLCRGSAWRRDETDNQ